MYPPPAGQGLTDEQAQQLDDTFLAGDPFAYFSSRIASLLIWHDNAPTEGSLPQPEPGSIRAEFDEYLQRPAVAGPFQGVDVHAQVAAEALAVRHHAAESLLRLACARLAPTNSVGSKSLWAEVAAGPRQVTEVIKNLKSRAQEADWSDRLFEALVESEHREAARHSAVLLDACKLLSEWLGYAAELLRPAEIDSLAGHNKVKHGFAVRARSDMRVMIMAKPPGEDGSIPLSAVTGPDAVTLFDQPVLELLDKPRIDGHTQGLELTQVHLKPAELLAEAYMLAMAHGMIYRVASVEHFAGRDDLDEHQGPPQQPGYQAIGPRPMDIVDPQAFLGIRLPLTMPPGGQQPRPAGFGFRHLFQTFTLKWEDRMKGHVVDD